MMAQPRLFAIANSYVSHPDFQTSNLHSLFILDPDNMILLGAVFIYMGALIYIFMPTTLADTVSGDKTMGGLHFFEVHSTNGGMGIGIKLLVFIALLAIAIYCYYKWKAFKKRLSNVTTQAAFTTIANTAPANPFQQVQGAPQYPMAPYAPLCPYRHPRRERPNECHHHEDEDCARLP